MKDHSRGRIVTFLLLTIGVSIIVFAPIGWTLNRSVVWVSFKARSFGIPLSIPAADFLMNVALFAVPLFVASLVFKRRWWMWGIIAFGLSVSIELIQHFLLPRNGEVIDLVANTLGGLVVGVIALIRERRRPRAA